METQNHVSSTPSGCQAAPQSLPFTAACSDHHLAFLYTYTPPHTFRTAECSADRLNVQAKLGLTLCATSLPSCVCDPPTLRDVA